MEEGKHYQGEGLSPEGTTSGYNATMIKNQRGSVGRALLFVVVILLLLLIAFKMGQRGNDPRAWFAAPTPTPTDTATFTPTDTPTPTATDTETATPTLTPSATPKPKPRVAAAKKAVKPIVRVVKTPTPQMVVKATPSAPPPPAEPKPICTVTAKGTVAAEDESNDVFYEAHNLGSLGMGGQISVAGNLSEVGINVGSLTGDTGRLDPKSRVANLDRDVFEFSMDEPGFRAILDCYTTEAGSPNPTNDDNDYQMEIYDSNFILVGSSIKDDPVEHVECTAPGKNFYAVIYGFAGKPGKYRLTIIK